MTEVIIRIGDWEHECCGEAVEVNQIVEFRCLTLRRASGEEQLVETHHDSEPDVYVRGRVSEISVVDGAGVQRSIVRVPSGLALRGFDPRDDGHLEEQHTGVVVDAMLDDFDVKVIANEISKEST
ncbi:DUF6578 domain-containing protein [Okibacterium fritillariae]|uniref:Uncharacterized protein n=1 Tax=Okibacterium fritillariae TaxID=123320 RepID=A0A1T5IBD8_9MICO|nr:DUF6578 domain-containing protein [Okibacterium fritillariae]SKC36465.1 hypothetical protein SAMN06309945_0200 [Okibacterium fritillariae]